VKVIAWNVVLTVLIALVALGAHEAYLRYTIGPMQEGTLYEYTLKSKRYKLMKPNAHTRSYGADVRTNDLGFRDVRASIPPKAPGELRIIVIGDSITFGPGIEYDQLYTSRLEAALRRSHPEVRVINLSVEGYNIIQYEAVLEEVGLGLHPDMVLVGMFPVNDFELGDYENHRRLAAGERVELPWYLSLYVYRAYLHRVPDLAHKALTRVMTAHAVEEPDRGRQENLAALHKIATIARERNLPLGVLLLPHTKGFETQRKLYFPPALAFCQAEQLSCFDLLADFQRLGLRDGGMILNAIDPHPNEQYNRLIAAELVPYVSAMLPPAATPTTPQPEPVKAPAPSVRPAAPRVRVSL
jgi:GDSL-like Lipase/Acylhydrolase family